MCGSNIRVVVFQKEPELLYRLAAMFGGTPVKKRVRSHSRFGKQDQHEWRLHGAMAAGLLMTLYGIFSAKRRRETRAVLEKWRAKGSHPGLVWRNYALRSI